MMNLNADRLSFFAALAVALAAPTAGLAQEAEPQKDGSGADKAMLEEVKYVAELVDNGFTGFAEDVAAAAKKKWPEAETHLFAIEIRGLVYQGRYDDANARIAALPDRKSAKFWAAKIEVANSLFSNGKRDECAKIYDEFFKANAKPSKELAPFAREARTNWAVLLMQSGRVQEALAEYEKLMASIDRRRSDEDLYWWRFYACEATEIYLKTASEKKGKDRKPSLDKADKLIKELLWSVDMPLFFGRAVAYRAHWELLSGRVDRAQSCIGDYMETLLNQHNDIVEKDRDGRKGLLRMSPMPQCRYLLAEILWKEAKDEAKKQKPDDERVRSLLFGEKDKRGQRNKQGAFNHAYNVYYNYPESKWAAKAGKLATEIAEYTEKTYGKKVKTNVTPAQEARVRAFQYRDANEKMAQGDYKAAIAGYMEVLADDTESAAAVSAIENVAKAWMKLAAREKDEKKKEEFRLYADAVSGYVSERFAGAPKPVMTAAGDTTLRLAHLEKMAGDLARADRLYKAFLANYRRHVNAPTMAVSLAGEAYKGGRLRDAVELYSMVDRYYTNSTYWATALNMLSTCYNKLGDRQAAIAALDKYVAAEQNPLKSAQAKMNLARLYELDGQELLAGAETNATPEEVSAQLKRASAQVMRGIREFRGLADLAAEALADPGVAPGDKKQYEFLRETGLYLVGDCWTRITKPEDRMADFRSRGVSNLEEYVALYPRGAHAKAAYVRLGTIYTVMGDVPKCKDALARLRKEFPDSEEAKKAMPRLARSLVEFAKTVTDPAQRESLSKEASQIYKEMIATKGAEYQALDFVKAGESLVEARDWSLADVAFEKAIARSGTNQFHTVARARLGKAKSLVAQKNYTEARESLDQYMEDKKMSSMSMVTNACELLVKVAMIQGKAEKDDIMRSKHFGAAIGALQKLRGVWKNEPVWRQDLTQLMSFDVKIAQIEAEVAMGRDEAAAKLRGITAGSIQAFIQSRLPTPEHPIDKFAPEELANLEGAFARVMPLFVKMGREQASRALHFGQEYMKLFPNGEFKQQVQLNINAAIALGAKEQAAEPAAPAAQPQQPAPESAPTAEPAPEAAPAPAAPAAPEAQEPQPPEQGGAAQ